MDNRMKRPVWPYIAVAVAVIVVFALLIVLVAPDTFGTRNSGKYSLSEYAAEDGTSLKSPSDHDDLYKTLEKHIKRSETGNIYLTSGCGGAGAPGVIEDIAAQETIAANEGAAGNFDIAESENIASAHDEKDGDYSDTNIRTQGVLEGDIVKTDGRYIYSLREDNSVITIADSSDDLKIIYSGNLFDDITCKCHEFYVYGDYLYVTGSNDEYIEGQFRPQSFLMTYDIKDKTEPEMIAKYTQDGWYETARMTEGSFYLFTNYYVSQLDESNFIPTFNAEKIAAEDIYYGKYFDNVNYYCMGAVDLKSPDKCSSAKAVITGNGTFYVSNDTIYLLSNDYVNDKNSSYNETNVVTLGYESGSIKARAITSVPGYLNDSFSLDEHNGNLRMVTTISEFKRTSSPSFLQTWFGERPAYESRDENALYIFDNNLNMISSIEGIQEDETIKSSRFLGDTLYFVTFRQTDPLFAVDLSDPANPKILDGLKVSGFSNYLHFYSDDLLLGIGYEADEVTGITSGAKVSMFDISDPTDIKEIHRFNIDGASSISSDFSYKSVLVDPDKNLIGFATAAYHDDGKVWGSIAQYHVLSYDEDDGFTEEIKHQIYDDYEEYYEDDNIYFGDEDPFYYEDGVYATEDETAPEIETKVDTGGDDDDKDDSSYSDPVKDMLGNDAYLLLNIRNVRGLYIGNRFYIVHPGVRINEYNLNNGKETNEVVIYDADK